ncbi:unnamed protein product [Trichobilharzia regenti]|nr:unnamed protein product [Trichobilharzia regenti]
MRPWTRNVGFPVVSVSPLSVTNNQLKVKLSQEQYKLRSEFTKGMFQCIFFYILYFSVLS